VTQSLASMTGFARVEGMHNEWRWVFEIKSVNGRGLELRCRLPMGFESLETELRKEAKEKLARGNVNISMTIHNAGVETRYRINEAVLDEALNAIRYVREKVRCARPRPEGILSLRGVMEPVDEAHNEEVRSALTASMIASFQSGLDALLASRLAEGSALAKALDTQFSETESLVEAAGSAAAAAPAALKERLTAQLHDLLSGSGLPEDRLAQEAALLAVKADIREELDRLKAHIAAGRALLAENGPVGRKLDFLTQEFNREANTLCSKASDIELKRIGLELKNVIDQMREQVQNIE
jgi:uncharacterized protein (TIGR00255 family)